MEAKERYRTPDRERACVRVREGQEKNDVARLVSGTYIPAGERVSSRNLPGNSLLPSANTGRVWQPPAKSRPFEREYFRELEWVARSHLRQRLSAHSSAPFRQERCQQLKGLCAGLEERSTGASLTPHLRWPAHARQRPEGELLLLLLWFCCESQHTWSAHTDGRILREGHGFMHTSSRHKSERARRETVATYNNHIITIKSVEQARESEAEAESRLPRGVVAVALLAPADVRKPRRLDACQITHRRERLIHERRVYGIMRVVSAAATTIGGIIEHRRASWNIGADGTARRPQQLRRRHRAQGEAVLLLLLPSRREGIRAQWQRTRRCCVRHDCQVARRIARAAEHDCQCLAWRRRYAKGTQRPTGVQIAAGAAFIRLLQHQRRHDTSGRHRGRRRCGARTQERTIAAVELVVQVGWRRAARDRERLRRSELQRRVQHHRRLLGARRVGSQARVAVLGREKHR